MLWIGLAIAAHFCWALVNITDKYFVTNRVKDPLVFLWWSVMLGVGFVAVIPFVDFFVPPPALLAALAAAGLCYLAGSVFYFRAVAIEDITRINIWWGLIPVFTLVIAWLAIDEVLSARQLMAFALLVGGAVIASLHVGARQFKLSRAFWLMVVACLLYASYGVLFRFVTQEISFGLSFVWSNIFTTVFALGFFAFGDFRRNFGASPNQVSLGVGSAIFGVALIDALAMLFNVWAISLGPAALVFSLEGFQALFVFALAIMISLKNPKLLDEELDWPNVILKAGALLLLATGIIIMYV